MSGTDRRAASCSERTAPLGMVRVEPSYAEDTEDADSNSTPLRG
jgi:hypothetical protein